MLPVSRPLLDEEGKAVDRVLGVKPWPRVAANAAPAQLPAKVARLVISARVHDDTIEAPHEAAVSNSSGRANKGVNLTRNHSVA